MIQAEVICDSINEFDNRITTMIVEFPRYILAEAKTHRIISKSSEVDISDIAFNDDPMLSKNSASSRAIPLNKMVKMVQENPFIPIAWMKDHKGMQGTEYFTDTKNDIPFLESYWRQQAKNACDAAIIFNGAFDKGEGLGVEGLTKQMCNRLLEPFMWHKVLVTATEWDNFWELRCPDYIYNVGIDRDEHYRSRKDMIKEFPALANADDMFWLTHNSGQADIHMMMLAEKMWDAYNESKPKLLKAGEWHLPYGDKIDETELLNWTIKAETYIASGKLDPDFDFSSNEDFLRYIQECKIKIATARCARTSFNNFDGTSSSYEKDIELHDKLVIQKPIHASPAEHCSRCMNGDQYYANIKEYIGNDGMVVTEYGWLRNFRGWIQYRTMIDQK